MIAIVAKIVAFYYDIVKKQELNGNRTMIMEATSYTADGHFRSAVMTYDYHLWSWCLNFA